MNCGAAKTLLRFGVVDCYRWDIAEVPSQRPFGSLLLTDDLQLWMYICVNRCVEQAEAERQGCQLPV